MGLTPPTPVEQYKKKTGDLVSEVVPYFIMHYLIEEDQLVAFSLSPVKQCQGHYYSIHATQIN